MKLLRRISEVRTNKHLIFLLLILLFGAFLRFYRLEARATFDADQEEIATKALELFRGDPVLLGPKTSVGGFSIGPGFTYLWAVFSLFMGKDPAAGVYLSVFIGLATIILFYVAGKTLFDKRVGLIAAFLASFSLTFISWDQSPWAPSLFYLSQIIMLIGAFLATKKSYGLVITAAGLVLGFQSHLGIFLSLFSILVFWLFYKPILKAKQVLISLAIVFFGFLPGLVFDIFNNFVNLKRGLSVFEVAKGGEAPGLERIIAAAANSAGTSVVPLPNKYLILFTFFFIVLLAGFYFLKNRKEKSQLALLLFSISIPIFLFMSYREKFSEYYMMMLTPLSLLLVAYLISKLTYKWKALGIAALILIALYNVRIWTSYKRAINLKAKKDAIKYVIANYGKSGYGISLSTALGQHYGFKYLFSYYGLNVDVPPKKGETKIITILVPPGVDGIMAKKEFDGVGVLWQGFDK
jgi:4-amino-4-deoxy-L-arabinose transferase-like glycosyltransferase